MEIEWSIPITDAPAKITPTHFKTVHKQEGMHVHALPKFEKIGLQMIKFMMSQVVKGNLNKDITFPSKVMSDTSVAKHCLFDIAFLAEYCQLAASSTNDPIQRAKLIFTGLVAGLVHSPLSMHAMMPVPVPLLSTLQAKTPSNVDLYFESIGPKKNDAVVTAIGPDNSFTLWMGTAAKMGMRGVVPGKMKVERLSKYRLQIGETRYELTYPTMEMDGPTSKVRTIRFVGNFGVKDLTNGVEVAGSVIRAEKAGWFKKAKDSPVEDLNKLDIKVLQSGKVVGTGEGLYSAYVAFDGKLYWTSEIPAPQLRYGFEAQQLPSDVSEYEPLNLVIAEDFENADKLLKAVDAEQQAFVKLRGKK